MDPEQARPRAGRLAELAELVADGDVVVLSGAGISTESGIPDYRGPTGAQRSASPMTFQTFTRDPVARRRYWARSHLGWHLIARARPNAGHRSVARLQAFGTLRGVITQNVDGLHTAAGATDVVELHGNLDRVICLSCGRLSGRSELDRRLTEANPAWEAEATRINPDGDVSIPEEQLDGFRTVDCLACGGMLKPDVVYFGETVPAARVERCFDLVDEAGALLVLGSSLTVMSGYRFVLRAAKLGIPIAIVNAGVTRGDAKADLRLDLPLGSALTDLAGLVGDRLAGTSTGIPA